MFAGETSGTGPANASPLVGSYVNKLLKKTSSATLDLTRVRVLVSDILVIKLWSGWLLPGCCCSGGTGPGSRRPAACSSTTRRAGDPGRAARWRSHGTETYPGPGQQNRGVQETNDLFNHFTFIFELQLQWSGGVKSICLFNLTQTTTDYRITAINLLLIWGLF